MVMAQDGREAHDDVLDVVRQQALPPAVLSRWDQEFIKTAKTQSIFRQSDEFCHDSSLSKNEIFSTGIALSAAISALVTYLVTRASMAPFDPTNPVE